MLSQNQKSMRFFLVSFCLVALVFWFGSTARPISLPILILIALLFSAVFTACYRLAILITNKVRQHSGAVGESKYIFILSGFLIFGFLPVFTPLLFISGLWSLLDWWNWPVVTLGVTPQVDFATFLIGVPFWGVIGGFAGYLVFRLIGRRGK